MSGWLETLSEEERSKLSQESVPEWREPMKARLTHDYFSDPNWIFERKLDGQRLLASKDGQEVRLYSRNRKKNNGRFPEIVEAIAGLSVEKCLLDGEIVAFEGAQTSFSRLQPRMQVNDPEKARASGVDVYFYVFDVMHLDGYNCEALPLRTRKSVLQQSVVFDDPLRFTEHRNEDGEEYLKEACRRRWEGLIAKDARSKYRHTRSSSWLKFKCSNQQEFVIGGYSDPEGSRKGFGALLLGYYEDDRLCYAGKVGTGFSDRLLEDLRTRMNELERKTSPFDDDVKERNAHWITPELVGEIAFTEWTADGKLRHPRFLGLREDKEASEVVREQ
ncbi:MAG: non-homologous end-joining DNA ligase [Bacteroidota bacterium]